MKTKRTLTKGINWVLAGIISLLGFAGCEKIGTREEYGSPHADYIIKGAVVNKATGESIKGIRVGYSPEVWHDEFGALPEYYYEHKHVITDAKGEFKLTERSGLRLPSVYIEDIDGEENGLFHPELLEVNFNKAEQSGKPGHWYKGEYTLNLDVELTEIEEKE